MTIATKNTVSNTPAHCHDCHQFADCKLAQNMMADTPPEKGWVHNGEVYCEDCGGDDGNGYPYGGESDCPTHCAGCGVPIIHELTIDGVEYVRAELSNDSGGCCREVWPTVWADYDVEPKIPVDSIKMPERFVQLCSNWYGGQDCMLYAVSSTGGLTIGTHLPRGCDSDEQWYLQIWRELSSDMYSAIRAARLVSDEDYTDLLDFGEWVDSIVERLEESYGLSE